MSGLEVYSLVAELKYLKLALSNTQADIQYNARKFSAKDKKKVGLYSALYLADFTNHYMTDAFK